MVMDPERIGVDQVVHETLNGIAMGMVVETGLGAGNGGIRIGPVGLEADLVTNANAHSLSFRFPFVLCVLLLQQLMARTTLTMWSV